MINIRAQSDRVQVFFWEAVIQSLSKLRALRTYQQDVTAPSLHLQQARSLRPAAPATRFQVPMKARAFLLQWGAATFFGFLIGFLYGYLH